MHEPTNLDELRQAVIDLRHIRVRGAGTKPALSDAPTVSTAKLRGVISYDPSEFTFTALAGTPLAEIRDLLTEHGQFLCFDPPLVDAGATLGGTVASGLSGPGRLRFGGVRDFLLGAQLVTGEGRVVFGGGKVVKNAAGFDIPKLMVGGLGQYGVLAELTFKVFPRPESYATLEIRCRSLGSALSLQAKISACPLEPACLDLLPDGALWVRVGGLQVAQAARLERLRALASSDEVLDTQLHEDDRQLWSDASELTWATDASGEISQVLARIALTPKDIPSLEQLLKERTTAQRRYSVAGNVAWIGCGAELIPAIDDWCSQHGRTGLVLRGTSHRQPPILGQPPGAPFRRHLKSVFDPQNKLTAQA
ncbi:MAG: FAD-binding protein [Planctomycetales bacterium]|nr:FAD-binding protein [Planctomycetales bacterium]